MAQQQQQQQPQGQQQQHQQLPPHRGRCDSSSQLVRDSPTGTKASRHASLSSISNASSTVGLGSPTTPAKRTRHTRRGGCRRCCCCCGKNRIQVEASPSELSQLHKVLQNDSADGCLLLADTVIGNKAIPEGALLRSAGPVRVGTEGCGADDLHAHIRRCAHERRSVVCTFRLPGMKARFGRCVTHRPCCAYCCIILLCLAFVGGVVGYYGFELDMAFDKFTESDIPASMMVDAWAKAKSARPSVYGRRLIDLYNPINFYLTYAGRDGGNVMTSAAIAQMQDVEQRLRNLPIYKTICDEDIEEHMKRFCKYGTSLANFVYAHKGQGVDSKLLYFNGTGSDPEPLAVALDFAYEHEVAKFVLPREFKDVPSETVQVQASDCHDLGSQCAEFAAEGQCEADAQHELYMWDFCNTTCGFCGGAAPAPTSDSSTAALPTVVTTLRSHFHFQRRCCTEFEVDLQAGIIADHAALWNEFVKEVVEMLKAMNAESDEQQRLHTQSNRKHPKPPPLKVYYNGVSGFVEYETMQALQQDAAYATAAFFIVMSYSTLHTRNPIYAMGGLLLVMISVPATMGVFMLTTGAGSIQMLMFLSIFIVIAIGSDMIFVYTEVWKRTLETHPLMSQRLQTTYFEAVHSTTATTFTTAVSFFANLLSPLRALREFGFFMGCCVTIAWFLMMLGYPPMLIVGERVMGWLFATLLNFIQRRGWVCGQDAAEVEELVSMRRASTSGRRNSFATDGGRCMTTGMVTVATGRASLIVQMASLIDPQKSGMSESHATRLDRMARCVFRVRCPLLLFFLLNTSFCTYLCTLNFHFGGSEVQIFHDTHNQEAQKQFDGMFEAFVDDDRNDLAAHVDESRQCVSLLDSCPYYSLSTMGRRLGSEFECPCYLHGEQNLNATMCSETAVIMAVVGREGLAKEDVTESAVQDVLRRQFPGDVTGVRGGGARHRAYVLAEHWESGRSTLGRIVSLHDAAVSQTQLGNESRYCYLTEICYCDHERASQSQNPGSAGLLEAGLRLSSSSRRLSSMRKQVRMRVPHVIAPRASVSMSGTPVSHGGVVRQLEFVQTAVHPQEQACVEIVFGLELFEIKSFLGAVKAEPTEYFAFKPEFRLENPETQRRFLAVCEDWPVELRVTAHHCWVQGFKDWWLAKGGEWPLHESDNFHAQVYDYAMTSLTDVFQTHTFMWFSDSQGDKKLVATFIRAFVDLREQGGDFQKALDLKRAWDDHWLKVGQDEPVLAEPIHVATIWRTSEATSVIVQSIITTFAVALLCVLLGVALFTRSLHLAAFVGVTVICIVLSLLFIMLVIMKWELGTIEVLSLIIFMGFAVDYCLHIAHKYHSCQVVSVTSHSELLEHDVRKAPESSWSCCSRAGTTPPSAVCAVQHRSSVKMAPRLSLQEESLLSKNRTQERFERTRYAITSIGSSVVGSALTTLLSSAVLTLCEIHVFFKIGIVIMAVTLYALIYALLSLTAMLMIAGPCQNDSQACKEFVCGLLHGRRPKREGDAKHHKLLDEHRPVRGPRRYVLNMPPRTMGGPVHAGINPSRTKIVAGG